MQSAKTPLFDKRKIEKTKRYDKQRFVFLKPSTSDVNEGGINGSFDQRSKSTRPSRQKVTFQGDYNNLKMFPIDILAT